MGDELPRPPVAHSRSRIAVAWRRARRPGARPAGGALRAGAGALDRLAPAGRRAHRPPSTGGPDARRLARGRAALCRHRAGPGARLRAGAGLAALQPAEPAAVRAPLRAGAGGRARGLSPGPYRPTFGLALPPAAAVLRE